MGSSQLKRDFLIARVRFNGHRLVSIEHVTGLTNARVGQIIKDRMRCAVLAVPRPDNAPDAFVKSRFARPMDYATYWLDLLDRHEKMLGIDTQDLRLNDLKEKAKLNENQPATA